MKAGNFSIWVKQMVDAIKGRGDSEVPCNGCTACCTSSQFIHVGPDETETLAHIPKELLFPAPGLPRGFRIMGFDEQGHCPMFTGNSCSIYSFRPRTCRMYDCRIFPATGLTIEDRYHLIGKQAERWEFEFESDTDRVLHEACKKAASFLRANSDQLPGKDRPTNRTQLAVLAMRLPHVFLQVDESEGTIEIVEPDIIRVVSELANSSHRKNDK